MMKGDSFQLTTYEGIQLLKIVCIIS